MLRKIKQIKTASLTWLHVVSPGEQEIQFLRDNFQFHPLDLEDCSVPNQRPKIDVYEKYIFLVLLFPFYDRRERKILGSEVDFFIGRDFLITVTDGRNTVVDAFLDDCLRSDVIRDRYVGSRSSQLLYGLLHRLQEAIFPMLDHVSEDITRIEERIFAGSERRMVREILMIRRNIVNFRRIMNAHKNILKKLINAHRTSVLDITDELAVYYDNILDRSKEIWEVLENQKETITTLHDTNDALISFKLNDIMKILTAISVSMLPATLIASIFGMNTVQSMPLVHHPQGFWILLSVTIAIIVSVAFFFRRKDWL